MLNYTKFDSTRTRSEEQIEIIHGYFSSCQYYEWPYSLKEFDYLYPLKESKQYWMCIKFVSIKYLV